MFDKLFGNKKKGLEADSGAPSCFTRLHSQEREEFFRLLRQTGGSLTPFQEAVVDEFLLHEGHLSPEFMVKKLQEQGIAIDSREVQSILDLLCRYGMAQKVQLNGTGPWYEHLHLGHQHDHLMCVRCGKIVEFEDDDIRCKAELAARSHDFQPVSYRCTIYGVCPECQVKQQPGLPLSMVSPGERVRVVSFSGGSNIKKRLQDMGLTPGEVVEVLNRGGPVIVSVKGSRIALGMGLAQKVMVRPEFGQDTP